MPAKKILIAEDDKKVQRLLSMVLAKEGYYVINAADGYQAMDFASAHIPDLLILDVHMPAGGGISVQERLQNLGVLCAKPIIYLTGDHSDAVKSEIERLGAFALMYKPFDSAKLVETVRAALLS
jgi:DNA-binding response OmpR family regulator